MRLTKVLCIAALVAMSAAAADAGSILNNTPSNDPKLTINKPGGGMATHGIRPLNIMTFTDAVTSAMHPLIINYSLIGSSEMLQFVSDEPLNAPETIHNMFIEIVGIPPGPPGDPQLDFYTCNSNIFSSLGGGSCGGGIPFGPQIGFELFNGTLTTGDIISVSLVNTPEASTVLLFLSLIPVLFFATKRWNARQTA
jgi:hypothetical protein